MKRKILNFKQCISSGTFPKLVFILAFVFVLGIGSANNTDIQPRGGGHSSPSWHYSHMPGRGEFVHHAPIGASRFHYGDYDFYYRHGIFYRSFQDRFMVVGPPFGLRLDILPRGFLTFWIGGFPYYYYCGTYYMDRDGGYEVVAPPAGAVVESLPKGYEKVEIDGQTYYTVDGIQYKPILKKGEIWYEVIKSPTKASEDK